MARQILFNTEMVMAILDGKKSVTRRLPPKSIREAWIDYDEWVAAVMPPDSKRLSEREFYERYPLYRTGDLLYVRETFRLVDFEHIDGDWSASVQYMADESIGPRLHHLKYGADERIGWRPSIHMPREAARTFLRVTDVRVERLQNIDEKQAKTEGARSNYGLARDPENEYLEPLHTAREDFVKIWNSTIKPRDLPLYGWDANPWVWVIEFDQIDKTEAGI